MSCRRYGEGNDIRYHHHEQTDQQHDTHNDGDAHKEGGYQCADERHKRAHTTVASDGLLSVLHHHIGQILRRHLLTFHLQALFRRVSLRQHDGQHDIGNDAEAIEQY